VEAAEIGKEVLPMGSEGAREAELLSRDEFVLYKSVYGDFSDSPVTGIGQRARLYFNDARDLAAVCLTTYANKLNDYYDGVLDPESCVYSLLGARPSPLIEG